jgi:hypothetical protein
MTIKEFDMTDVLIRKAISDYGQLTHSQINDYMRGTSNFTGIARQDGKSAADLIKLGFERKTIYKVTKSKLWVFRGIVNYGVAKKILKERKGGTLVDRAFLSTSTSDDIARSAAGGLDTQNSVFLEIYVPAGVRYLEGRREEKELIFNSGTRLKIREIRRMPETNSAEVTVDMEK